MQLAMEIQQVVNIRKRLNEWQLSRALKHFVARLYLRAYIISRAIFFFFCECVCVCLDHILFRDAWDKYDFPTFKKKRTRNF